MNLRYQCPQIKTSQDTGAYYGYFRAALADVSGYYIRNQMSHKPKIFTLWPFIEKKKNADA